MDTVFYRRENLPVEARIAGPAVILQVDATTVVPPGWTATVEPGGNMVLRRLD